MTLKQDLKYIESLFPTTLYGWGKAFYITYTLLYVGWISLTLVLPQWEGFLHFLDILGSPPQIYIFLILVFLGMYQTRKSYGSRVWLPKKETKDQIIARKDADIKNLKWKLRLAESKVVRQAQKIVIDTVREATMRDEFCPVCLAKYEERLELEKRLVPL